MGNGLGADDLFLELETFWRDLVDPGENQCDGKADGEKSEQELLDYAQRNNIVNLSERETIARKRLADLSDEFTLAETELITARSRYEAATEAPLGEFPEILKSDAVRRLERRLSEARSELASFSSRYGPEWPAVKETRIEIQDLEDQLADEKRRALAGSRQDFQLARDRHDRLERAVGGQRACVPRTFALPTRPRCLAAARHRVAVARCYWPWPWAFS